MQYRFRMRIKRLGVVFGLLIMIGTGAQNAIGQRMSQAEFASQLRLAEVYEQTRDIANALRIYEKLQIEEPNNSIVFDALVRDYFYTKRYADVEKLLKTKLEKSGADFELLLLLGRAEAKLDRRDSALQAFKQAQSMINQEDCGQLIPVVTAMADVNYNKEASALLLIATSKSDPGCAGQAANLYLRMADYGNATKQYLVLLSAGESNLPLVEQRIAQFTSDSAGRALTLTALRESISKETPTLPALQLLAWMYSEAKDYRDAYGLVLKIDSINGAQHGSQGFELLMFAEKARNESALDIAVKAYDEAIIRIKQGAGKQNDYFLAQAELGALKTTESYLAQKPDATKEEITSLVERYENYAKNQAYNEFALDALTHAGELAYARLFDLGRATRDFAETTQKAKGYSDPLRNAYFRLVDVAIASGDLALASTRLNACETIATERGRPNEQELRMHVMYDRALIAYYQSDYDSARFLVSRIMDDPTSDFANDAIQLAGVLDENHKPNTLPTLKLYAAANLAEFRREWKEALEGYRTITVTAPSSPIADDATLRLAEMEVKLGLPDSAATTLETMQDKMTSSPLLDQAAFRAAEIVERDLHDKKRAQKMYEDFLERYPRSNFDPEARARARRLRGDVF